MRKYNAEIADVQVRRSQAISPAEALRHLHDIDAGTAPEEPGGDRVVARELIGEAYENGRGVPQDYAAA
jgi:TPR repeat protein